MTTTKLRYAFLIAPLIYVAACSPSDQAQQAGPGGPGGRPMMVTQIVSEKVRFRQNAENVESVGTARAKQAATIFPEASGEVLRVNFEPGQFVKAGMVLATLESTRERLDVARAKVTLQDSEQLLARYERIDVDGAISESQIDAAKTSVEAAKIGLQLAEEALSRKTVRAPFSGYVGLTDIDAGAIVNQQTEITRLDDRSVIYVDFSLPEQVFGRINVGDVIPMVPFAAAQQSVDAEIAVVDSRIDAERRSFMVRAKIDNTDDTLRPGMSFRINYQMTGLSYPSVPEAAIVWGGDGPYIWVVEEGIAQRTPVTIISRQDGDVLVQAPLDPEDIIISEGVQKVRQGAPVREVNSPAPERGGAGSGKPLTSAALQ